MAPTENLDVCLATLRDTDRDRYLACLLSPADKRNSLAALYAFNAEIARIRDSVREALPGEVRMQWWRDLLEGNAHGDSLSHPVAAALLTAIEQYRLPRPVLANMIEARIFDLYDDLFEDRNALEGYAGETASALIQLASLVLSAEDAPASAEAAGHAGVAQAMAGILLLMPLHRRRGQVYIPADMLAAAGLDRETFLEGDDRQRIGIAIELFAAHALDHLEKARRAKIPRSVFAAYLPVALSGPVILAARKAGVGVFEGELQLSQLRRQWALAKASFLKRF
ncbi:phytoene/squalene synthase family protein [Agrobacterium sp. O3.4]|uniref:Phytoene/squalene synthase family protein n=1 Tax=Agrobacterium cucumeris TaxID=2862866 RepID=A0ABY8RP46_9HYPH|nr:MULTISPECIES: phytoene/squalene synthase family protein [Rhizobium/Agrobacterium group]MCZ7469569.1 phytoene/squalene synthase family protein [Rhizobium rhizogenes]MDA5632911.1 phytoene/squalene synthase family protein [Agrobacterium sp. ST15.16.024]MDF1888779.1 phytoene/squalene synthase family protein [Rhizobium rhizogenes]WHO09387.1 phytoene/squalene synthase family protein [Agrobacterium cucumeris]